MPGHVDVPFAKRPAVLTASTRFSHSAWKTGSFGSPNTTKAHHAAEVVAAVHEIGSPAGNPGSAANPGSQS